MTYNVFGGTLNLAQSINLGKAMTKTLPQDPGHVVAVWLYSAHTYSVT